MNQLLSHKQGEHLVKLQLEHGIDLLRNLERLLKEERNALEKRDLDAFRINTNKKEHCLQEVLLHEQEFENLLKQLGLNFDSKAIAALIKKYDADQRNHFSELALKYESLLEECDKINLINGRIIQRSQINTHQLLDLIKGATRQAETYNRAGKKRSTGGQTPIARA